MLKAPVKVLPDVPPKTNVPAPVLVRLAPPTESLMTPERVAKSPVELGLSSISMVRVPPAKSMPFWISVSYWAEVELRIMVPAIPW